MTFWEAEQQYQQLVQQWQAGQITQQGFMSALDNLQVQGTDGSWWRIRAEDGAWLWWNGSAWIEAVPPHRTGAPVAGVTAPKKRRWWLTCSVIVLLSCFCLALVGGGGYLAVQAGSLSAMQLSAQIAGAANVDIVNLDDNALTVDLDELDVPEENAEFDRERIESFDIGGFASLEPGRYRLAFESSGNALLTVDCIITLENGDSYQFVAVPEGMAITREGEPAQDAFELDVSTSSLCRE